MEILRKNIVNDGNESIIENEGFIILFDIVREELEREKNNSIVKCLKI